MNSIRERKCRRENGNKRSPSPQLGDERHFAVFFARGLEGNLHVLAQSGEKVHEAFDGKGTRTIAQQGRNVRLLDAQNLSSFGLPEATLFNDAVDLQRELCFQKLLFGVGQTQVSKNIPTAFYCLGGSFCSRSHVSSAFPCGAVRLRPSVVGSGPYLSSVWRCPVSISSGRRAKRRSPPENVLCRQHATCRRADRRQFQAPIRLQTLSASLPRDRSPLLGGIQVHGQCRAAFREGSSARLSGLSQPI
jgi:hypothetical protein